MKKHFDTSTLIVIIITVILFIAALFTKGFSHDLFLEAGVLLISAKLILMAYKNSRNSNKIEKELKEIKDILVKKIN